MHKSVKVLAATSAVVASLAVASTLYAHDSEGSAESMMGSGMTGMMQQMIEMMEGCSTMMQSADRDSSSRPNEQWRKDAPRDRGAPDRND